MKSWRCDENQTYGHAAYYDSRLDELPTAIMWYLSVR